jgi:hypothetical protein
MSFLNDIKSALGITTTPAQDEIIEQTLEQRRDARKAALAANPWWLAGRSGKSGSARSERRAAQRDKIRLNKSYRKRLANQQTEASDYADRRAVVLVRKYERDHGLPVGGGAASLYRGNIPAGGVDIFQVADGLGLIEAELAAEEKAQLEGAK